jgi:hypothetical protein
MSGLSLKLMMDGNIGEFHFNTNINGKLHTEKVTWTQDNFLQNDLFFPLQMRYSQPYNGGIILLTINQINGHATVSFPMGNGPCIVQFMITSILPWQPEPQADMMGQ